MNITVAKSIAKKCVMNGLPVLLTGAPGVGKTDIVAAIAAELDYDLLVSHPVVEDPTDAKGLPFPSSDGESARFLPYGLLAKALSAKKPTIWFLDDLGQANAAVQASYMQLLLSRKIGEHHLPDCITFVAATNRKADRAGVSGILEPVKSRFAAILPVETDLETWTDWALDNRVPSELIAFIRFRPDLLHAFKPSSEIVNSPSPRTWANAGRLLALELEKDEEHMAISGAVGPEAAVEFVSFLRVWRDLPSPDSVLLDPERAKIPDSVSALHALCSALAFLANAENFGRITRYAMRLNAAQKGEFASCLIKDCMRRNKDITQTAAFVEMASGELGELFN